MKSNQEAMGSLARYIRDFTCNMPPLPGVFPDYLAPIVRNNQCERELAMARVGHAIACICFTGPKQRLWHNPTSAMWNCATGGAGWAWRCVVPFTSFSENEVLPDSSRRPVWFAFSEERPLAFFAAAPQLPNAHRLGASLLGTSGMDLHDAGEAVIARLQTFPGLQGMAGNFD
jgi:putative SOS response-associated peptidase YedK